MTDAGDVRAVAIAGTGTWWGAALARRLEREPGIERIYGIDTEPPPVELGRTELIEADIRSPLLSRVLPTTDVDTVVHCGIVWYPAPGKPARALHDINVIGSLQLLAACEKLDRLRRIVVRGSAAVYGSEPAAPSFFSEEMARSFPLRTRFQRDIGELETYFENFARRHPAVTCCMLRFQPELGPELDTPLSRYMSLPVVPTQLGFDPRMQFVHEDDADDALLRATLAPVRGAVNIAPSGSISLSRAIRLSGRTELPVPHPMFGTVAKRAGGQIGLGDLYGDAKLLLRYGRGVDNSRMIRELGFRPRYDAVSAVRDFGARTRGRQVAPIPTLGGVLGRIAGDPR